MYINRNGEPMFDEVVKVYILSKVPTLYEDYEFFVRFSRFNDMLFSVNVNDPQTCFYTDSGIKEIVLSTAFLRVSNDLTFSFTVFKCVLKCDRFEHNSGLVKMVQNHIPGIKAENETAFKETLETLKKVILGFNSVPNIVTMILNDSIRKYTINKVKMYIPGNELMPVWYFADVVLYSRFWFRFWVLHLIRRWRWKNPVNNIFS